MHHVLSAQVLWEKGYLYFISTFGLKTPLGQTPSIFRTRRFDFSDAVLVASLMNHFTEAE